MPHEAAWGRVIPQMLVRLAIGWEEIHRTPECIVREGGTLCFTFKRLPNRIYPSPLPHHTSVSPIGSEPVLLPAGFAHVAFAL
jgi:hypothetical protein